MQPVLLAGEAPPELFFDIHTRQASGVAGALTASGGAGRGLDPENGSLNIRILFTVLSVCSAQPSKDPFSFRKLREKLQTCLNSHRFTLFRPHARQQASFWGAF